MRSPSGGDYFGSDCLCLSCPVAVADGDIGTGSSQQAYGCSADSPRSSGHQCVPAAEVDCSR